MSTRRRAGFTLVELLVVIGIIALLISILLPALGKARESANAVKCSSNLRSVGQGIALYVASYRGAIPASVVFSGMKLAGDRQYGPGGTQVAADIWKEGYINWSSQLFGKVLSVGDPIFGSENGWSIFTCPSLEKGGVAPANTYDANREAGMLNESAGTLDAQAPRLAYMLNEGLSPRGRFGRGVPGQAVVTPYHYVQAAKVRNAAATVLASENWGIQNLMKTKDQISGAQTASNSRRPVSGVSVTKSNANGANIASPSAENLYTASFASKFVNATTADMVPDPAGNQAWNAGNIETTLNFVGRNHGAKKLGSVGGPTGNINGWDLRQSNFLTSTATSRPKTSPPPSTRSTSGATASTTWSADRDSRRRFRTTSRACLGAGRRLFSDFAARSSPPLPSILRSPTFARSMTAPADTASPDLVDLLIVGGGPVGLYGAFYAGLRQMSVKIVDSLEVLGGQLMALYPEKFIYDVAGFPKVVAKDLVNQLAEQGLQFGAVPCLGETVQSLVTHDDHTMTLTTNKATHRAKLVLIAAGVGSFTPRPVPIPNANQWLGRGLHYFVKEMSIFKDKRVLILGGGDSAIDWANMLAPYTASQTLIHRRDKFRAHEDSVEKMMQTKTHVMLFHEIQSIEGDETGIRRATVFDNRTKVPTTIEVDAIVSNFGFVSALGPIKEWGLTIEKNQIAVDRLMQTNRPRVFSAGDICTYEGKMKLIATGFGEAATAVNFGKTLIDPKAKLFPGHSSERDETPVAS